MMSPSDIPHDAIWLGVIGAPLAALSLIVRLLAARGRTVALAGAALAWIVLLASIAATVDTVRDHALLAALAAVAGIGIAWLLAGALRGRIAWIILAGAVVIPIRLPIPMGGSTGDSASLLLPLYVVLALGLLTQLRIELATPDASRPLGTTIEQGQATRLLDMGVALYVAWACLTLIWSLNVAQSASELGLFLIPFTLMYILLRSWTVAESLLSRAGLAHIVVLTIAALVGIYQALTTTIWWNHKVIDANRFKADFRTNSLFWDPNIYGRYLVSALLALFAWWLASRLTRRQQLLFATVGAVLVTALWNTFSQSSLLALGTGCLLLAILTLPSRMRRGAFAVVVLACLLAIPIAAKRLSGADETGRARVARDGIALAGERPLAGVGVGAFETGYIQRTFAAGEKRPRLLASHTTPVTVLAEQGIFGAITYLLLLAAAGAAIIARWRRAGRQRVNELQSPWPVAGVIWATSLFVAIIVHSLLYASFFEEPLLWVALAVLASLPVITPSPRLELVGEPETADESRLNPAAASDAASVSTTGAGAGS